MAAAPPILKLPKQIKDDNRDIADIWAEALKNYKGIVGFDLKPRTPNVQGLIELGSEEVHNFHKFRHNESKTDRLRSHLSKSMSLLEKGSEQLIEAATPAFPPAAAIGTAITWMLTACRQVSADYDVVDVFFEDLNSFLQRIVILETRMPRHKAYQNCLMDVFSSFLSMCGFATQYIKAGRFKKWVANLVSGEENDLGDARKQMDTKLDRLRDATNFAILGNTEEMKTMNQELLVNQQSHVEILQRNETMLQELLDERKSIRSDIAKLLKAVEAKHGATALAEELGPSRSISAFRFRCFLPTVTDDVAEYQVLKETIVDGTCTWIFSEPAWESWSTSRLKLLIITGDPGTGKSHIAATVYDHLSQNAATQRRGDGDERVCATHFYFREQHPDLSQFKSAVITTLNQVADQDDTICEQMLAVCRDENVVVYRDQWQSMSEKLLEPVFAANAKNRLIMVLDGIDELSVDERQAFEDFVQRITKVKLRISVVVTSRPDTLGPYMGVNPLGIKVTIASQKADLRAFVQTRLNMGTATKAFGAYIKKKISEKIENTAPSMLYAEHMLRRFEALGREGAVLRYMEQPLPPDVFGLYDAMLSECQRRTVPSCHKQVATLLRWLLFSRRPLTLDEVVSLLRFASDDGTFSLEDIPEFVSKFLRIGDPGKTSEVKADNILERLSDNDSENDNHEPVFDDGALVVKFRERSMRSYFHETRTAAGGSSSEAQRRIFLAVAAMTHSSTEISTRLLTYATRYLMSHWMEIQLDEHSAEEQAEVMEALAVVLSNHHGFSALLQRAGVDYTVMFADNVLQNMTAWASLSASDSEDTGTIVLSIGAEKWWREVAGDSRKGLFELAKGHFRALYEISDDENLVELYNLARDALVHVSEWERCSSCKPSKNSTSVSKGEVSEDDADEARDALGLAGLFGELFSDIPMNLNTYRVCGRLLHLYQHFDAAYATLQAGLACDTGSDAVTKFQISFFLAQVEQELEMLAEASSTIKICLESNPGDTKAVPSKLKRAVFVTRAEIEARLGNWEASAASYQQAREAYPSMPTSVHILDQELASHLQNGSNYAGLINAIKQWTPIERLTWLCNEYNNFATGKHPRHALFQESAARTHEQAYLVSAYHEAIQYLDAFDASAPLQYNLATAYMSVLNDLDSARRMLDEVLDSTSTNSGYLLTNANPQLLLHLTTKLQASVLLELFTQSRDPTIKADLFSAVKGLSTRPLANSMPMSSTTMGLSQGITLARMSLKMCSTLEFQRLLQSVIDDGLKVLSDSVGQNDAWGLSYAAIALWHLSNVVPAVQYPDIATKLRRAARVLFSCTFSKLDPAVGLFPSDTDPAVLAQLEQYYADFKALNPPEEEGDLSAFPVSCDGTVCNSSEKERRMWFGGRSLYLCTTCEDVILCDVCYAALRKDASGEKTFEGRRFCAKGHQHVKGPIEGWRGVRSGVVTIEGEEGVSVKEVLEKILGQWVPEAWGQFWEG
ncbi:hypothetical protein B0H63DRAFT_401878 [Podospora didyma]|uniref:Fungal STAND N-terminal Goodbye domain-containing protein n=1 Tax=Podospora didyma TaxID=330526 RepID=A0AAE0K9P7_9PEZI|nr:hypothetical protein B0H63DRAFT_401878 [Podospora didyma]